MLYEVRVEGEGSFEYECEEPLEPGIFISPGTMAYQVTVILPGQGKFDHIAEALRRVGPSRQVG
jgi:hypothetical protein